MHILFIIRLSTLRTASALTGQQTNWTVQGKFRFFSGASNLQVSPPVLPHLPWSSLSMSRLSPAVQIPAKTQQAALQNWISVTIEIDAQYACTDNTRPIFQPDPVPRLMIHRHKHDNSSSMCEATALLCVAWLPGQILPCQVGSTLQREGLRWAAAGGSQQTRCRLQGRPHRAAAVLGAAPALTGPLPAGSSYTGICTSPPSHS